MFEEVIIPVDGSSESARALGPANAIAHALGVSLRVVAYHVPSSDGFELRRRVRQQLSDLGPVRRTVETAATDRSVAEQLEDLLEHCPRALLVMSTRGAGRSAAVIGSVANHVLAVTHRPVLLVGPAFEPSRFRTHGPMIIATDSSERSEPTLELAGSFVQTFDFSATVVNVVDPASARVLAAARSGAAAADLPTDSVVAQRHAHTLSQETGRNVSYEVLHDDHPGRAIARHANEVHASVVVMATRARAGFQRLALGSVTADVLHEAKCPVLAVAPAPSTG